MLSGNMGFLFFCGGLQMTKPEVVGVRFGDDIPEEFQNVTIPELAQITKTKESFLYEKSRFDRLPGQFRVGRFVRINLPTFFRESKVKATEE
jgi:hypothetical protein